MAQKIKILTTELEKIMDGLVANQFTGGVIEIVVDDPYVTIRDVHGAKVTSWTRQEDEINQDG